MARRRYLSTDISIDARVNRLAMHHGDFAALLYTWLIPHVEDDARLEGTAEEILLMVMPGRRDKQPEDIAAALQAMHDLGLIVWSPESPALAFPESFYGYQTYIKKERRMKAQQGDGGRTALALPPEGDQARPTPQNAAEQRNAATSPQNAASFSSSSSSSFSSPPPSPPDIDPDQTAAEADAGGGAEDEPGVLLRRIDDVLPDIVRDFRAVNPGLHQRWLGDALGEAEIELDGGAAELSARDVKDALHEALTGTAYGFAHATDEHPIGHPQAFARSKVVEALSVRLLDIRERRRRPAQALPDPAPRGREMPPGVARFRPPDPPRRSGREPSAPPGSSSATAAPS